MPSTVASLLPPESVHDAGGAEADGGSVEGRHMEGRGGRGGGGGGLGGRAGRPPQVVGEHRPLLGGRGGAPGGGQRLRGREAAQRQALNPNSHYIVLHCTRSALTLTSPLSWLPCRLKSSMCPNFLES